MNSYRCIMKQDHSITSILFSILKTAAIVIVFTFLMLFLFALMVYQFHLSDSIIQIGILVIYFIANFIGGLIIGKVKKEKKFLWGILAGLTYFIILSIASFIALQGFYSSPSSALSALLCCIGGGFFGGMLA